MGISLSSECRLIRDHMRTPGKGCGAHVGLKLDQLVFVDEYHAAP
jgi:hypothetical protein